MNSDEERLEEMLRAVMEPDSAAPPDPNDEMSISDIMDGMLDEISDEDVMGDLPEMPDADLMGDLAGMPDADLMGDLPEMPDEDLMGDLAGMPDEDLMGDLAGMSDADLMGDLAGMPDADLTGDLAGIPGWQTVCRRWLHPVQRMICREKKWKLCRPLKRAGRRKR